MNKYVCKCIGRLGVRSVRGREGGFFLFSVKGVLGQFYIGYPEHW
jgi:hypothetical protein